MKRRPEKHLFISASLSGQRTGRGPDPALHIEF
jgi:hypothetical protein